MVNVTITQATRREKLARAKMLATILRFAHQETLQDRAPNWPGVKRRRAGFRKRYKRLRTDHALALFDLEQAGGDVSGLSRFQP